MPPRRETALGSGSGRFSCCDRRPSELTAARLHVGQDLPACGARAPRGVGVRLLGGLEMGIGSTLPGLPSRGQR